MGKQVESGMGTYVGHFRRLIHLCEHLEGEYAPRSEELGLVGLWGLLERVERAMDAVDMAVGWLKAAQGVRMECFDLLLPLSTRLQSAALTAGVAPGVMGRIREVVRRMHGRRVHGLKGDVPAAGGRHISVVQMSYPEQMEHLNVLITILEGESVYAPVEGELGVVSLRKRLGEMREAHNKVLEAEYDWNEARFVRNRLLYAKGSGMMDVGLRVKEYVKAVFGAGSVQYKEVRRIRFHNDNRNR